MVATYSDEDIDSAVNEGVLSDQAASAFRDYATKRKRSSVADEENFRLVTGFNDIFVAIAIILLLISVGWIGVGFMPWVGPLAMPATAWWLSEVFTRKHHMALPSVILSISFVQGIWSAMLIFLGRSFMSSIFIQMGATAVPSIDYAIAAAVALLAAVAHWRRFHVPITFALASVSVGYLLFSLAETATSAAEHWWSWFMLGFGLIIFAVAMKWDMLDPKRLSSRSDVAFWLHLFAAPLIAIPIFHALNLSSSHVTYTQAFAVILVYAVFALISIGIDRRALMASALFYVIYTFADLLKQHGVVSLSFAIAACIVGSALLVLSAFWHNSRTLVIKTLPHAVQTRLPPTY